MHVRVLGAGPPLLLLHERPNDGTSLLGLAGALANSYTAVIPDLTGHGASDAPPDGLVGLEQYADDLEFILKRLGIGACGIYATGNTALLAKHLALRQRVIVDKVFIHDEAPWTIESSGTLLAPEQSGAHLMRLWDRVVMRALFLPGLKPSFSTRLARGMPSPDALHATAVAYLKAADVGESPEIAGAAELASCNGTDRTAIVRIASATLDAGAGCRDARFVPADGTPCEAIREAGVTDYITTPIPSVHDGKPTTRVARRLIRIGEGHLHVWMSTAGRQRPVLALHDPAGSARLVLPFVAGLAEDRPIIVPDLPGNGESDWIGMDGAVNSATYAAVIARLLAALGVDEVDVIGRYSGGPIGMELARASPGLVAHLVIAALAFYDRPDRPPHVEELLARYTPSVRPRPDGSHFALAWHIMKSQALYWPWYRQDVGGCIRGEPQLDPKLIHRRVVDLAICGDRYQAAYAALWTYPMRVRLPALRVPTLVCAPAWDPLYGDLAEAVSAAPNIVAKTLPNRAADWHHVFRAFFDKECG
jgi:pimeloyl-ACP methyl ester carboxylesterase